MSSQSIILYRYNLNLKSIYEVYVLCCCSYFFSCTEQASQWRRCHIRSEVKQKKFASMEVGGKKGINKCQLYKKDSLGLAEVS